MKIVAKQIDMIAKFNREKVPVPYKFRYEQPSGEYLEIKIDKILAIESRRLAGIETIIYTCQSEVEGEVRMYELKYIIGQYRWELYKI